MLLGGCRHTHERRRAPQPAGFIMPGDPIEKGLLGFTAGAALASLGMVASIVDPVVTGPALTVAGVAKMTGAVTGTIREVHEQEHRRRTEGDVNTKVMAWRQQRMEEELRMSEGKAMFLKKQVGGLQVREGALLRKAAELKGECEKGQQREARLCREKDAAAAAARAGEARLARLQASEAAAHDRSRMWQEKWSASEAAKAVLQGQVVSSHARAEAWRAEAAAWQAEYRGQQGMMQELMQENSELKEQREEAVGQAAKWRIEREAERTQAQEWKDRCEAVKADVRALEERANAAWEEVGKLQSQHEEDQEQLRRQGQEWRARSEETERLLHVLLGVLLFAGVACTSYYLYCRQTRKLQQPHERRRQEEEEEAGLSTVGCRPMLAVAGPRSRLTMGDSNNDNAIRSGGGARLIGSSETMVMVVPTRRVPPPPPPAPTTSITDRHPIQ